MKTVLYFPAITCILFFLFANTSAQEQHRMKFTAIHFDYSPASDVEFNNQTASCNQIGGSASVNAGGEYINMILEYDYRNVKLNNFTAPSMTSLTLHEFYLGFRYYPMRPTFMSGNMAVRLTGGGLYGFDMEPNWKGLLFAGLAFSSITNTSGFTINVIYHPKIIPVKGYSMHPAIGLRVGFIIGPSMN